MLGEAIASFVRQSVLLKTAAGLVGDGHLDQGLRQQGIQDLLLKLGAVPACGEGRQVDQNCLFPASLQDFNFRTPDPPDEPENTMSLERRGTKIAKEEFSALFASLRSDWYDLILPPRYVICLSSTCFRAADQES